MEILNVRSARSVWLFEARDLNPRGVNVLPLVAAVKEKYQFLKWPNTPEELVPENPKGSQFQAGAFAIGDLILTVSFTLYNDGIVAETLSSTKHTDLFLEDLLSFGQQFGLVVQPDLVQRKRYISELIVRPKRQLGSLSDRLDKFAAKLNQMSLPSEAAYEWTGFEISAEPRFANQPGAFKFEREVKSTFDLNRFYSIAPLHTDQHEELLRDLEAIMALP